MQRDFVIAYFFLLIALAGPSNSIGENCIQR